jgi:hypothetical protein
MARFSGGQTPFSGLISSPKTTVAASVKISVDAKCRPRQRRWLLQLLPTMYYILLKTRESQSSFDRPFYSWAIYLGYILMEWIALIFLGKYLELIRISYH